MLLRDMDFAVPGRGKSRRGRNGSIMPSFVSAISFFPFSFLFTGAGRRSSGFHPSVRMHRAISTSFFVVRAFEISSNLPFLEGRINVTSTYRNIKTIVRKAENARARARARHFERVYSEHTNRVLVVRNLNAPCSHQLQFTRRAYLSELPIKVQRNNLVLL